MVELKGRSTMTFLRTATVLAILAVSAAPALANSDGFSGFGPDAPPGVTTPDLAVDPDLRDRESIRVYGDEVRLQGDQPFTPINEFAGQTYKTDPGIIGGALGRFKNSIFGGE